MNKKAYVSIIIVSNVIVLLQKIKILTEMYLKTGYNVLMITY